jgi:hypothetical protein
MSKLSMITICVSIRDLLKKASELKSKSKAATTLKAELACANDYVKELRLDNAESTQKILDVLARALKAVKSIRSAQDKELLSEIEDGINAFCKNVLRARDEEVEPSSEEAVAEVEEVEPSTEEAVAEVEEVEPSADSEKPMDAKAALKAAHARAKELRAANPDMTYQAALKQATNEIYSQIPKKEKKAKSSSKPAVSKEETSNLLKKAHAIARELRATRPNMKFAESLKIAFKQVYEAV